jgi:hypothetical protein
MKGPTPTALALGATRGPTATALASGARRGLTTTALALLAGLLLAGAADADFTAATLLSGTAQIQFANANAPALSADGRYVVFQGVLADIPGIYRRDLQTGEVEQVAGGDASEPADPCNSEKDQLAACDASAPSVSADGRYIAFTTTADLQPEGGAGGPEGEPAGDKGCPEVYVRDMGPPGEPLAASAPGAYTLASALDGTDTGISFGSCPRVGSGLPAAGAQAAPAVAMSADGRHVVFTVLSESNLTRGPDCSSQTPLAQCPSETPPSQVAVRDLTTHTTTLVSATPAGQATPDGGAFPSGESESVSGGVRVPEVNEYADEPAGSSAAISADASTVAWLGTNVPYQVPSATDVAEKGLGGGRGSSLGFEAEPLWRRVADGPAAVTRRLLSAAGIDLFFNIGQEGLVLDGSFIGVEGSLFIPPVLSEDGSTVAVIANAPAPTTEDSWLFANLAWPNTDAYVVHVTDDPASMPQVTALTATPNFAAGASAVRSVKDIAISPDGTRVAFDTSRSQFALPSLAFASPPFDDANYHAEIFEANLTLGTLQRVTSTFDGSEPNGNAGLLAFSGSGQELAFASSASNLFYGDGVPASEVYLVQELPPGPRAAQQEIGAAPNSPPPSPEWKLGATALAQADGSVLVQVQVPGAGRLGVSAGAQLPAPPRARSAPRVPHRRASGRFLARERPFARGRFLTPPRAAAPRAASASGVRATSGAHSSRSSGSRAHVSPRRPSKRAGGGGDIAVPFSTVAQAVAVAGGPSVLQLRLRVLPRYRTLIAGRLGLYAIVRVSFAAADHASLTREMPVVFRIATPRKSRTRTKRKTSLSRIDSSLVPVRLPGELG